MTEFLTPKYITRLVSNNKDEEPLYVYKGLGDPELIRELISEQNYISGYDNEWEIVIEEGQFVLNIPPSTFKTKYKKWIRQSIKKGILLKAFDYDYKKNYDIPQEIDCIIHEDDDSIVYKLFTNDTGSTGSSVFITKNGENKKVSKKVIIKEVDGVTLNLIYVPQYVTEGSGCKKTISSGSTSSRNPDKCEGDITVKGGPYSMYSEPDRKEHFLYEGMEEPSENLVGKMTSTLQQECTEVDDDDYIKINCNGIDYYRWSDIDPRTKFEEGTKIEYKGENYYNIGPCEKFKRQVYELKNAIGIKGTSLHVTDGTICEDGKVVTHMSDNTTCESTYSTVNVDIVKRHLEGFTLFSDVWGWMEYLVIFIVVLLLCLGLYHYFNSKSKTK